MSRSIGRAWRLAASVSAVLMAVLTLSACSSNDSSSSSSTTITPTATIFVQNFKYHDVPATLPSGIVTLQFENKESFPITHEMIPVQLPEGATAQDVIDAASPNDPESEDQWLHIGGDFGPIDTGAALVETLYLPPGNYVFACWQTGTQSGGEDGPPHAAKGMVTQFTVA